VPAGRERDARASTHSGRFSGTRFW
jgi:hypothetical protein